MASHLKDDISLVTAVHVCHLRRTTPQSFPRLWSNLLFVIGSVYSRSGAPGSHRNRRISMEDANNITSIFKDLDHIQSCVCPKCRPIGAFRTGALSTTNDTCSGKPNLKSHFVPPEAYYVLRQYERDKGREVTKGFVEIGTYQKVKMIILGRKGNKNLPGESGKGWRQGVTKGEGDLFPAVRLSG